MTDEAPRHYGWLVLAGIFAAAAGTIAIVAAVYVPERAELLRSLITVVIAAALGAGLGVRSGPGSSEPSDETRDAYRQRSLAQSRGISEFLKAPIVWVALFSTVGFSAIYLLT